LTSSRTALFLIILLHAAGFNIAIVMNITYIHLRVRGSYIYTCTGGREYTKNPMEKYNNRKTNTYLIPLKLMVDQQH
jgi:hypothetical protein